jgi:hypothetical protein
MPREIVGLPRQSGRIAAEGRGHPRKSEDHARIKPGASAGAQEEQANLSR